MNQKNTKCCQLKRKKRVLNVRNIHRKYVNITVNSATFLFVNFFSEKHLTHDVVDIFDSLDSKKVALKTDLKELEEYIYPVYQEIKSYIPVQKDNMHKNSQNLKTAINRNEEIWHREIENIVKKLKSEIDEMDSKHLTILNKWELEIKSIISEIIQSIADLKKMLASTDINLVSAYKSKKCRVYKIVS